MLANVQQHLDCGLSKDIYFYSDVCITIKSLPPIFVVDKDRVRLLLADFCEESAGFPSPSETQQIGHSNRGGKNSNIVQKV